MQYARNIHTATAWVLYGVITAHFVRALYFVDGCEHIQRRVQGQRENIAWHFALTPIARGVWRFALLLALALFHPEYSAR